MIVCPNCKHKEHDGALFCSECGSQLTYNDPLATSSIRRVTTEVRDQLNPAQFAPTIPASMTAKLMVYLVDYGQFIPIQERTEFTLGRESDGQPIMPDIDLTSYKAYENGVSRLHAVVRHVKKNFFIMDLGSANGTYINGTRISPNVDVPITTSDIVSLGKLKFQIILNN